MSKKIITLFYVLVFIAHIFLLYWIIYVLKNAGLMKFNLVMIHFVGLAIFGSGLIISTALGTKHIQKQEWKIKHQKR